jgi:hypothetical protein
MTMAQLENYEAGDVVWLAWVHIEQRFTERPVAIQSFVNRVVVVNGGLDVVSADGGLFPPRTLYSMERVFASEAEGRLYCARVAESAAAALMVRAKEMRNAAEAAVSSAAGAV